MYIKSDRNYLKGTKLILMNKYFKKKNSPYFLKTLPIMQLILLLCSEEIDDRVLDQRKMVYGMS